MARMKVDILGVSEVGWPEAGDIWNGEYRFLFTGILEENPGMGGVSVMLEKDIETKVKRCVQHREIIILVKIEIKPKDTVVVQVYMSTSNSSDRQIEEVYEQINKAKR